VDPTAGRIPWGGQDLEEIKGYNNGAYGGNYSNGRWHTDKWGGDNALMTMMISSTTMKTTSNKKYDKGGWI
jgi:hypothetical protein